MVFGVERRFTKHAVALQCCLGLVLLLYAVYMVWDALTSEETHQEEDAEWGNLPNIMLDSSLGIIGGTASIRMPGVKAPLAVVTGQPMLGQPSKIPGPPPCKCNANNTASKFFFPLGELKIASLVGEGDKKTTKFGITFDIKFYTGDCPARDNFKGKCPAHSVDVLVPGPDEAALGYGACAWEHDSAFPWIPAFSGKNIWECCPVMNNQCPLKLTTIKKTATGWPFGFDYYLFKKFRGKKYLFQTEIEAHFRVASASVGASTNPSAIKFMMKVDTTTVPTMLLHSVFTRLATVWAEIGGYAAIAGAVFAFFFVPKFPNYSELTLTGHEVDVLPPGFEQDSEMEYTEMFEEAEKGVEEQ